MQRRTVTDALALGLGPVGIESGSHEDRAASGVEVEHFGRVRRQLETVLLRPAADLGAVALQHGDVKGVDLRRKEHLRRGWSGGGRSGRLRQSEIAHGFGLAHQSLQGPVAAAFDLCRYAGQWRYRPELAAASDEVECGDVVLDAVRVAGERRRTSEVDCAVRADESAARECRPGTHQDCNHRTCGHCHDSSHRAPHLSSGADVTRHAAARFPSAPLSGSAGPDAIAAGCLGGVQRIVSEGKSLRGLSAARVYGVPGAEGCPAPQPAPVTS